MTPLLLALMLAQTGNVPAGQAAPDPRLLEQVAAIQAKTRPPGRRFTIEERQPMQLPPELAAEAEAWAHYNGLPVEPDPAPAPDPAQEPDSGTEPGVEGNPPASGSPTGAPAVDAVAEEDPAVAAEPAPSVPRLDGYQQTRWGMTRAQVAQLYPDAVDEGPEALGLTSRVAGEKARIGFHFVADQLVSVSVAFVEAAARPARPLELYATLQGALATKYGPASERREDWDGEHFKAMERAAALALGGLRLSSSWQAGPTGITLSCAGRELRAQVRITYASLGLGPRLLASSDGL